MARTLVNSIDTDQIANDIKTSVNDASKGYLSGLITERTGNREIRINIGSCIDSTASEIMEIQTLIRKQTDIAFSEGELGGCNDGSSVAANTFKHIFVIKNPTSGVTDILISTSATAPIMPAGYTFFRRIGGIWLDGSANIRDYKQVGDSFHYTPCWVQELSITTAEADRPLNALPTEISCMAMIVPIVRQATSAVTNVVNLGAPFQDLAEPSYVGNAAGGRILTEGYSAHSHQAGDFSVAMHSSVSLAVIPCVNSHIRIQYSAQNGTVRLDIIGYIDSRGKE